jgi:ubiquinone/menaquinone biosynthesis C-methylase UbiE
LNRDVHPSRTAALDVFETLAPQSARWPTTGCDVTWVDVPLARLRIAADRAAVDRPSGVCWVAVADGAELPFENGKFDSISHSDVLCCLEAKLSVLSDCRRVVRAGGRMAFTVIVTAPHLSSADRERAAEFGPPFVETPVEYSTMLREAGWAITHHRDLTDEFAETARRLLREEEARADGLSDLLGQAKYCEKLARRRMTVRVIEEGFLRRELFAAATA